MLQFFNSKKTKKIGVIIIAVLIVAMVLTTVISGLLY